MGPKSTTSDFEQRLMNAQSYEVLEAIGAEIDKSGLSIIERTRLKNIGKQIFNQKFNF